MSTTRAFTGTDEFSWNRRVEARPEPQKVVDTRTPTQVAADFYLNELMKKEAREREEHKEQVAAARAKQQQAQAEQVKINRKAAFEAAEIQIADIFIRYGVSPAERERIEDQITRQGLWSSPPMAVEFVMGEAMKITTSHQEAREARIAAVRSRCDAAQWQDVLAAVDENRGKFSDEDLASGRIYEVAFKYLAWE